MFLNLLKITHKIINNTIIFLKNTQIIYNSKNEGKV